MTEVLVTITRLAPKQIAVAEAALGAIANEPTRFDIKAVREMKSEGGQVGARLQIGREQAANVARAAIWASLENTMRERGIVWKSEAGRTDALENQTAVTEDQITIQVLSHQVFSSAQADCGGLQAGKAFSDWDAVQFEAQELRKNAAVLCIQIYEVPTRKFEEGWCRPDGQAEWTHCGPTGLKD
jgi:hypothetical protein